MSVVTNRRQFPVLQKLEETVAGRWRHVKRGTTYTVRGVVQLQCAVPELDGVYAVLYVSEGDGREWVRPVEEFLDGRFERI